MYVLELEHLIFIIIINVIIVRPTASTRLNQTANEAEQLMTLMAIISVKRQKNTAEKDF